MMLTIVRMDRSRVRQAIYRPRGRPSPAEMGSGRPARRSNEKRLGCFGRQSSVSLSFDFR